VTLIANICFYLLAKVKTLTNVKAALPTLILSAFIIGQVTSTAHTHDHDIHDFEHIHDLEHAHNAWNDHQHIDEELQVVLSYALEGQLKPALYSLYLDAARAPPLT